METNTASYFSSWTLHYLSRGGLFSPVPALNCSMDIMDEWDMVNRFTISLFTLVLTRAGFLRGKSYDAGQASRTSASSGYCMEVSLLPPFELKGGRMMAEPVYKQGAEVSQFQFNTYFPFLSETSVASWSDADVVDPGRIRNSGVVTSEHSFIAGLQSRRFTYGPCRAPDFLLTCTSHIQWTVPSRILRGAKLVPPWFVNVSARVIGLVARGLGYLHPPVGLIQPWPG